MENRKEYLEKEFVRFNKFMAKEMFIMNRLTTDLKVIGKEEGLLTDRFKKHYQIMYEQYHMLKPYLMHLIANVDNAKEAIENQEDFHAAMEKLDGE